MTATSRPSATAPTNIGSEMDEDFPDITLEEADIDKDLINVAKRKHMRINRGQILDEDIKLYCRDLATGNSNNGLVLDISPGGLLMVSKGEYSVGDELLVSCRIGLNFRMKEQIKIRMVKGRKYGAEFINPSENTTIFLTQLYGAVGLGKPRTRNKHI
ncbi:MAG: PilZ domain-containing protein [Proteobacteria bacterium]|nr:PilZ domain-containing protein [Pseudomonadota bacterium]